MVFHLHIWIFSQSVPPTTRGVFEGGAPVLEPPPKPQKNGKFRTRTALPQMSIFCRFNVIKCRNYQILKKNKKKNSLKFP